MAASQYDILLGSETLVSDMPHVSELLVPGFGRPALSCRTAARCRRSEGLLHTCEIVMEYFAKTCFNVVVGKFAFLGFVVRERTYEFSLHLNPDLDDRIL